MKYGALTIGTEHPASVVLESGGMQVIERYVRALVSVALLLLVPALAAAQGVPGFPYAAPGAQVNSSLLPGGFGAPSFLPAVQTGAQSGYGIVPSFKIGYKRIGLNMNLGISGVQLLEPFLGTPLAAFTFPQYGSLLDLFPLDLKIANADLGIGGLRIDGRVTPTVTLYGSVTAGLPATVRMESGEGPGIGGLAPQACNWKGTGMQWSEWEIGAAYDTMWGTQLLAGIRWERTTVRMTDPDPIPAYNYLQITIMPLAIINNNVQFPDYTGDVNAEFTIPYLGVGYGSAIARGSFRIGAVGTSVLVPLHLTRAGTYIRGILLARGRTDISEQAQYKFNSNGVFLEADVTSKFRVNDRFTLDFWLTGNWMKVKGDGTVSLNGKSSAFLGLFTFPTNFSSSQEGPSNLGAYSFALGVSGLLNF